MASISYSDVLQSAQQLTVEEQSRLREALANRTDDTVGLSSADYVAFLQTADPIRPDALDALERALEEFEQIDPDER